MTMAEMIEMQPAIQPAPRLDPDEYEHAAEEAIPGRAVTVARPLAFRLCDLGIRVFACLLAFTGPLAIAALIEARDARAHEAMSGWTYDLACCSDHDCYEIAPAELEPIEDGWRIRATGDTIRVGDPRLRVSGDGHWHRCSLAGDRAATTLCLYVPAGG